MDERFVKIIKLTTLLHEGNDGKSAVDHPNELHGLIEKAPKIESKIL